MAAQWPRVPEWLVGVWERRFIIRGGGSRDSTVSVRYVQAPSAFVDIRVALARPAWPAQLAAGDVVGVAAALRARAPIEAFAGVTRVARSDAVDGREIVSWHAALNLAPPAGAAAAAHVWRAAGSAGAEPLPPTNDRGVVDQLGVAGGARAWREASRVGPRRFDREMMRHRRMCPLFEPLRGTVRSREVSLRRCDREMMRRRRMCPLFEPLRGAASTREASLPGADGLPYEEEWALLDDGGGACCAARRGDRELLVVVGDYFGYARDARGDAAAAPATTECGASSEGGDDVDGLAALARSLAAPDGATDGDGRDGRADGACCFVFGRVSTGWVIEQSAAGPGRAADGKRLVVSALDGWETLPGSTREFPRDYDDAVGGDCDGGHVARVPLPDTPARGGGEDDGGDGGGGGDDAAARFRFVPAAFEVPRALRTARLSLRPLVARDAEADLDAVLDGFDAASGDSPLRHCFARDDDWPWAGITLAEDLEVRDATAHATRRDATRCDACDVREDTLDI